MDRFDVVMGIFAAAAVGLILAILYELVTPSEITDKQLSLCKTVCEGKGIQRIEGGFRPECWCR